MDIIYALVPLSILLIGIAVVVFFWAVRSGQFDDMDSPAHKILFDDDEPINQKDRNNKATSDDTTTSDSSKNNDDTPSS